MRCSQARPFLEELLYKTISAKDRKRVESHLADCFSCRQEFDEIRRADSLLRDAVCEMFASVEVPAGLSQKIQNTLAGQRRRWSLVGTMLSLFRSPLAAVAVTLVIAVAGVFAYQNVFGTALRQADIAMSEKAPQANWQEKAPLDNTNQDHLFIEGMGGAGPEQSETFPGGEEAAPLSTEAGKKTIALNGRNGGRVTMSDESLPKDTDQSLTGGSLQVTGETEGNLFLAVSGEAKQQRGSLEEAVKAVGFSPNRPSYLPAGTNFKEAVWYPGAVQQVYTVDGNNLHISQLRTDIADLDSNQWIWEGAPAKINGHKAAVHDSCDDGGNAEGVCSTVYWQRDEWIFAVGGRLETDELLIIANSLE